MSTEALTITRRAFASGARTAQEVVTMARKFNLGKINKFEAQDAIYVLIEDGVFEINRYGGVIPVLNLDGQSFSNALLVR